jgi:hypothetical protein
VITVSVFYPKHSESHFDHENHIQKHTPLVWSRWGGMGLAKLELLRGAASLDGGEPGV